MFQPRFTIGLLYLCGFFFVYALLLAAPPLWEMWQQMPTAQQEQEGPFRPEDLAEAKERAREYVRPRLWIALAAALVTTGLGSYAGLLPGTGRR